MTGRKKRAAKSMRCKHHNGLFVEVIEATHEREVTNGVMAESGYNEPGNTIKFQYICHDCGKHWHAATPTSFRQKFINAIGEQL